MVPGVVFVEMAMEACRKHMGDQVQLTDVQMVWPLVVPKNGDTDEKQMWMRIAIIGKSRFELRSQGAGDDTWTTHCEGKVVLGGFTPGQAEAYEEVRKRCSESVDPAKLYPVVDSTGLWLGPKFQVVSDMVRSKTEISCKMMLGPDVPNTGYIIQPSLFDGTIHAVCATMLDQDPPFLKIFAGVGRVTVLAKEAPKHEPVNLHLVIDEQTEQQQNFTCTVSSQSTGEVLWVLSDVVFRKVLPEQIQKALEATKAKDAVSYFETQWTPTPDATAGFLDDGEKLLVLADGKDLLAKAKKELAGHDCQDAGDKLPADLSAYTKVVSVAAEGSKPIDVLHAGLLLLQQINEAETKPEVWFVLRGTAALDVKDLNVNKTMTTIKQQQNNKQTQQHINTMNTNTQQKHEGPEGLRRAPARRPLGHHEVHAPRAPGRDRRLRRRRHRGEGRRRDLQAPRRGEDAAGRGHGVGDPPGGLGAAAARRAPRGGLAEARRRAAGAGALQGLHLRRQRRHGRPGPALR